MLQNVSEDTDDMFDDLFDRYGKVVQYIVERTRSLLVQSLMTMPKAYHVSSKS